MRRVQFPICFCKMCATHDTNELWENFFFFPDIFFFNGIFLFICLHPVPFNRLNNRPNQFIAFVESLSMQPIWEKEVKFMAYIRLEGFRLNSSLYLSRFVGGKSMEIANDIFCAQWMCGINSGRRFSNAHWAKWCGCDKNKAMIFYKKFIDCCDEMGKVSERDDDSQGAAEEKRFFMVKIHLHGGVRKCFMDDAMRTKSKSV